MVSSTAFVSTFAPLITTVSSFTPSITSTRPPAQPAAFRMALETKQRPKKSSFTALEDNRAARLESEYRGPQGFTPYAEKVNGRVAMMGFFIGLVTEIASGTPINEQMLIMLSPLTHLFDALFRVIAG